MAVDCSLSLLLQRLMGLQAEMVLEQLLVLLSRLFEDQVQCQEPPAAVVVVMDFAVIATTATTVLPLLMRTVVCCNGGGR